MSTNESENEENRKPKVDLDKLLVEEIGQFGLFQFKIIAQCLFTILFIAWNINEFVFAAARIEHRCLIPECEDPAQTDFCPPWITYVIPLDGDSLDSCQRFGNSSVPFPDDGTCPASLFNTDILQGCEEHVYKDTNTVVYDFKLGCDEWRRAIVGSVRVLGMMVALAMTGYISDRWGRSRALAINGSCAALLGLVRYWSPSYNFYMVIMFLESAFGLGSFGCTYIMTIEYLGPKYRVVGAAAIQTTFALGQMTLGLIAWAVIDWRSLILALYIPQLLCLFYFWTLTESVRWLMSKGRFKESEDLLKEAARVNKKQLSQKSLDDLRANTEEEMRKESEANDKTLLVLLVLRDRRLLTRSVVTSILWITTTFIYYGLSFNAVHLVGNMYLNYVVVCAVEIPGFWIVSVLINKIGRKPTLIPAFLLCAACQVAFIFIPSDQRAWSLVAYLLGKFAISVVIMSMNLFSLELFPTEYRHRLYNFSSMMGRLGSLVAPLTPALGTTVFPELPSVLFGSLAFLAGILTFLLPETRGTKLADTLEEALSIEKKEKKKKSAES